MDVVVVESPAKAKTINAYLGSDFIVLASYGHVRDLPSKDGSVRPDDDFAMTYEIEARAVKPLAAITRALKGAANLYLATDPDREGEAISWHVLAALEDRNAVSGIDVKRVVFNQITRSAVRDAMQRPRDLDVNLVNAQQARRALDYLVGFTLSPVLWRKLPGAKSAGRVQSVALRLICERAMEIEAFRAQEYWTVEVEFRTADGAPVTARLVELGGGKLDKFTLDGESAATAAVAAIESAPGFAVANLEAKESRRNPLPPFTTSTLQQEASRKLGFSAKRTMQVAQRLYEGVDLGGETTGLITYMRTDGVHMAGEAIAACREVITARFGKDYVPEQPRQYRAAAKNAQEAHEAIRPTLVARQPQALAPSLDHDQRRLYELIWNRTIASQMTSAQVQRTVIDIASADGSARLRATGSVTLFNGFLRLYQEGRDDDGEGESERTLPAVTIGDALARGATIPQQHFTEPPPRYSEATLVKRFEELGIGRPSTYASIISVLQEREYVRLANKRFEPEDRGRLVNAFLTGFFKRYVEYGFTADLETKLDDVSAGKVEWKEVLSEFWQEFEPAVAEIGELRVRDVLETLNDILGPHVFHADDSASDPRACTACEAGRLSVKTGKFGAFIGCSNYPDCRYTRPLSAVDGGRGGDATAPPRELGRDPGTDRLVSVRSGPYGHYVQLGEGGEETKPKRTSLPKGLAPEQIDLATALGLLALPRELGRHPESDKPIVAGIGRYGPYLRYDGRFVPLEADDDVLTVGINRAVTLLAAPRRRGRASEPLRQLGDHPDDGKPIALMQGRYGPYVTHNRLNATLPKGSQPESVTLEEAVDLLRARADKPTNPKRRGKPAKTKATRGKRKAAPGSAD